MNDNFSCKDKQLVPFLLTQHQIEFVGTEVIGTIVYFNFIPLSICEKLANDFMARKAPLVQPKDLLDAVETFRDRIFEIKDEGKRKNYGGQRQ